MSRRYRRRMITISTSHPQWRSYPPDQTSPAAGMMQLRAADATAPRLRDRATPAGLARHCATSPTRRNPASSACDLDGNARSSLKPGGDRHGEDSRRPSHRPRTLTQGWSRLLETVTCLSI